MRRDIVGGDPLPHQGKYSGSFKLIAISVYSMLHANKIAMHAIFLMEMMNSCSSNISLVSSTQLSIFLSMDYLAHIRSP